MPGWMKPVLILVALLMIVLVPGCWAIGAYNGLQREQVQVDQSWAQVQNVYQRRADLVPNLVETVKGYAAHEQKTLDAVVSARAKASSIQLTAEALKDPEALKRFQAAQGELGGALSRLMAISENYPNLKANEGFLALQSQLEGSENRITVERQRFNEAVGTFNAHLKAFPANVVAGFAGLTPRAFFQAELGSEKVPQVKF